MRTRISLFAIVFLVTIATQALAASPAQIYNDYVRSGRLRCSYGKADLEALLRSGSINQYGDPLTLAKLKLAARRHLAGSCRNVSSSTTTTTAGGTSSTSPKPHEKSKNHSRSKRAKQPGKSSQRLATGKRASTGEDNGSFIAGRGLIIGLLAVALAFGGWLTKRALSTRD